MEHNVRHYIFTLWNVGMHFGIFIPSILHQFVAAETEGTEVKGTGHLCRIIKWCIDTRSNCA